LNIIAGPECKDNASWWKVSVLLGTKARIGAPENDDDIDFFFTEREYEGWVREGDYADKDFRFICKQ